MSSADKLFQWTFFWSLLVRNIYPYPNQPDQHDIMPEICNEDNYLDWEDVNEKALEKLTEIQQFMDRKDVMENVNNDMIVNHNRVRRHDYHDDHDYDDDHNIVVRCKHGYTGITSKLQHTLCF